MKCLVRNASNAGIPADIMGTSPARFQLRFSLPHFGAGSAHKMELFDPTLKSMAALSPPNSPK